MTRYNLLRKRNQIDCIGVKKRMKNVFLLSNFYLQQRRKITQKKWNKLIINTRCITSQVKNDSVIITTYTTLSPVRYNAINDTHEHHCIVQIIIIICTYVCPVHLRAIKCVLYIIVIHFILLYLILPFSPYPLSVSVLK